MTTEVILTGTGTPHPAPAGPGRARSCAPGRGARPGTYPIRSPWPTRPRHRRGADQARRPWPPGPRWAHQRPATGRQPDRTWP